MKYGSNNWVHFETRWKHYRPTFDRKYRWGNKITYYTIDEATNHVSWIWVAKASREGTNPIQKSGQVSQESSRGLLKQIWQTDLNFRWEFYKLSFEYPQFVELQNFCTTNENFDFSHEQNYELAADKMIVLERFKKFANNAEAINVVNSFVHNKIALDFKCGQSEQSVFDNLLQDHKIILKHIAKLLETPHIKPWIRLRFPEIVTDSEIDFCIFYYEYILIKDIWMIRAIQKNLKKINNNMGEPFRYLIDYTLQQAVEQDNFDIITEMFDILLSFNPVFSYRAAAYHEHRSLDLLCYNQEDVQKMLNAITLESDNVTDTTILEFAAQRCRIEHHRDEVVDNINKYLVRSLNSFFETRDGSIFSYHIGWIKMDHIFDAKYGKELQGNMERYNENKPNYRYKRDPETFLNNERNLIPMTILLYKDKSKFEFESAWKEEMELEKKNRIDTVLGQGVTKNKRTILEYQTVAIWALKRFLVVLKEGEKTPGFFEKDYAEVKNYIISKFENTTKHDEITDN